MITIKFTGENYDEVVKSMRAFGAISTPHAFLPQRSGVVDAPAEAAVLPSPELSAEDCKAVLSAEDCKAFVAPPLKRKLLKGSRKPGRPRKVAAAPVVAPEPQIEPETVPNAPPPTLQEVRDALHAFVERVGGLSDPAAQDRGREVLLKFGASKTSELPADQYAAFIKDINGAQ